MKKYASVPFFLTLVSDKIQEIDEMIVQLKEVDKDCSWWNNAIFSTIKNNHYWLKSKINERRDSLLEKQNMGKEYKF